MAWLCVGGALQVPSRHTSHRALYAASVAVPAPRAPAGGGAAVRGDGSVVVGGATVLEPGARRLRRAVALGDAEVGREAEAGGGVFLSFGLRRPRARVDVDLGYLPRGRLLSVARNKRWWMAPAFGDVPLESQLVVVEGADADAAGRRTYAAFLPLLTGGGRLRGTLRGAVEARGGDERTRLILRCESGDGAVAAADLDGAVHVSATRSADAGCVHGLVERAVEAAAARTGTFSPRRAKAVPRRMVDGLGWCTWDAFYSSVSAQKVEAGAAQESEIPNFKGSDLGRFPLDSADLWTSDHLSERSRSVDACSVTRARGTLTLKRR